MEESKLMNIIQDNSLTYAQELLALARLAENEVEVLKRNPLWVKALKERKVCDLGEGLNPYRPRYILPNYDILMEKGCAFLELEKPKTLLECCSNLLIFYHHVPSITSFPVYLGNFTRIFKPFEKDADNPLTKEILREFLKNIDKTLPDSFVHADIGPEDSKITRIILDLTREMKLAVPNITLLYNEDITPTSLALDSIDSMLKAAKPSFANDKMYSLEHKNQPYGIASCYNALNISGGGYTLPRLRLYEISLEATSLDDFFNNVLPHYVDLILEYIDQRVKFIVEESSFFKSNFLVKEGFVEQKYFTGMVGVVGVAECVNNLLNIKDKNLGFGHNEEANALAYKVLEAIEKQVKAHKGLYCEGNNNQYEMHAQVGIDTDGMDDAPGCRIPVGYEPDLFTHLKVESRLHKFFPCGVGDIFKFDQTWSNSKEAILDIIKGSFNSGMRYFTAYNEDNDLVRVTGYLVKKSEIEKLNNNAQSVNNCTIFGKGAARGGHALERKVYGKTSSK